MPVAPAGEHFLHLSIELWCPDEETCSPRVKKLATQLTEQRARRDELGLLIDEATAPEMPDTSALETLRADVEAAADAGSDEALRRVIQTFVHREDITSRETAAPTFIIPGDANVPTQRSAAASPGTTTERKVRTLPGSVHPTSQYTNLNLLVSGLPVSVKPAHAKVRRQGYGKSRRKQR
ncbi:hypothetical protein [Amycolatopsis orientalis]|uniref:hypothetical protein n=1 Tax=Amycolatopsis orientalis TaxID=31958 RepID=UPI000D126354|nr:hypothetical protein [Amycolatopsis orientalis]